MEVVKNLDGSVEVVKNLDGRTDIQHANTNILVAQEDRHLLNNVL